MTNVKSFKVNNIDSSINPHASDTILESINGMTSNTVQDGISELNDSVHLTEDITIKDVESIIDNEEWIRIIKDNNDNILFGIRNDGEVYWYSGVPTHVKNLIIEYIENYAVEPLSKSTEYNAFSKYALDMQPLFMPYTYNTEIKYNLSFGENKIILLNETNEILN